MEDKNRAPLIIMILAAFSLMHRPLLDTASAPQPVEQHKVVNSKKAGSGLDSKSGTAAKTRDQQIEEGPLDTIRDFFNTQPGNKCDIASLSKKEGKFRFDFLLATVPDPQDSRFHYGFDRNLESIQRAVSQNDYGIDRFWLPWVEESNSKSDSTESTAEEKERARKRKEEPGVLLYRKGFEDELLVVFLIGETPISGINKIAFRKSVEYILSLTGKKKRQEIKLVGPTFSGSIPSIRIAIRAILRDLDAPIHFCVATGSATNPCIEKKLGEEEHVDFHRLVQNDDVAADAFYSYLKTTLNLRPLKENVAVLSETGTAYGETFTDKKTESQDCSSEAKRTTDQPLYLTFSPHISRLRSAYQKDPELKALWSARPGALPRQTLELTVDDPGYPKDSLPSLSPLTPLSEDRVLSNILTSISHREVKYVGLAASDVRDILFLGQLIHKHCPDVRLFVFESDNLLHHPDEVPSFEGTLVVSTYPLFLENQNWTRPGSLTRTQFAANTQEGTYNACRLLLGSGHDRDPNKDNQALLEYTSPLGYQPQGSPPLWVTVVGSNGFWPVRLLETGHPKSSLYKASILSGTSAGSSAGSSAGESFIDLSRFSIGLFWSMTLFCLVHCFSVVNGALEKPLIEKWPLFRPFRFSLGSKQAARQRFYLVGSTISLLSAYVVINTLLVGDSFYGSGRLSIATMTSTVTTLVLFLSAVWISVRRFFPHAVIAGPVIRREFARQWGCRFACLFFPLAASLSLTSQAFVGVFFERHESWVLVSLAVGTSVVGSSILVFPPFWSRCERAEQAFGLDYFRRENVISIPLMLAAMGLFVGFGYYWRYWLTAVLSRQDYGPFLIYRATHVENGVSSVVPIMILCVALYYWAICHLRRLHLIADRDIHVLGKCPNDIFLVGIDFKMGKLKQLLGASLPKGEQMPINWQFSGLLVCLAIIATLQFWRLHSTVPSISVEGGEFDLIFSLSLFLLYGLVLTALCRFMFTWYYLRDVLRQLEWHPMRNAFSRLPNELVSLPSMALGVRQPRLASLSLSLDWWRTLRARRSEFSDSDAILEPSCPERLEDRFKELLESAKTGEPLYRKAYQDVQNALTRACTGLVNHLFVRLWEKGSKGWTHRGLNAENIKSKTSKEEPPTSDASLELLAEQFIALRFLIFIRYVILQLRNLLGFIAIGFLLLLLSVTTYPFRPQQPLLLLAWIILAFAVPGVLLVFVQMNRDAILSRITRTEAGKLNWNFDFITKVIAFGVIPMLTVIAAQFPQVGRMVFSWMEPILRVFH